MSRRLNRMEKMWVALGGALLLALVGLSLGALILQGSLHKQGELSEVREELRLLREKESRLEGQIQRLKADMAENAGRLKSKEEQLADAERVRAELEEQTRLRLEAEKRDQDLLKVAQQRVQTLLSEGQGSVFLKNDALTVRLTNNILFSSGRATLGSEGAEVLKAVAQLLNAELKGLGVRVEGHTDNEPIGQGLKARFPSNWDLSAARASAAIVALLENGVEPARLQAVGRADTLPVEDNRTEEGRAANRRIDFIIDLKSPALPPATTEQP
ncbi:MAG: OmpA family protein [Blastochloris sp.]|nr:OmpA family protein [Blastochloris sp.]